MGEVMVVEEASDAVSTSLRVLGERIETGWEHRTLYREKRKMGMPLPKPLLFLSPFPLPVTSLTVFQ
jgi:hypothetical protein